MPEQPSDPVVGRLIDQRYQVHSRVARGGMSTVYLATDLRLDRPVALKVMHHHLAEDPQFLDRLGREARAAARLSHPHVVGMLDQGRDGGLAYLAMEYIPGHTLRDVLNEHGALTPRLALAYLDAIVEGLGAAHAAGLVHRDVKPENVLLASDGRIKIGDFGLARAVTTTTSTGALLGTVAYVSPELVDGGNADARSDIYSVGILAFELLTGHQPFQGDLPVRVALQHVTSTVPTPSEELPGLSADLDELVRYCTEKDPEARPADGFALLEDIRHIRRTLTDAELDFNPAQARAGAAWGQSGWSTAETSTQLISRPTEIIGGGVNHTSVLPARPPAAVAGQPLYPPSDTGVLDRPSARGEKKAARAAAKDRARVAGTPTQQLRRGHPRRRAVVWLAVVLVLAIVGGTAAWFFGLGPGSIGTIPDVHNKTVAEAQSVLSAQGFSTTTKDVNDETVQQGLVVNSEPAARTQQRRYAPVTLLVSKGPVLYAVPALTGGTLDAAKTALNGASLALGTVTEQYDEQSAAGTVLSQDPAKGVPLRGATPVNLVVSKGPQPIPVPNVVGQGKDAAAAAVTGAGLTVKFAPETVNDKKVPAGSVVSQNPANGTLTKGGTVTLTISKGPKTVHVPSFVGKQADKASAQLKDLGFEVKINNILGGFFGTVRDQNPADQDVPEGSTVTLTVV